jgi:hypothetical protein
VHSALGFGDLRGPINVLRKASMVWVVVFGYVALPAATSGVFVRLDRRSDEIFRLGVRGVDIGCDVAFGVSVAIRRRFDHGRAHMFAVAATCAPSVWV